MRCKFPRDACGQLHIDGADDVTINQGVGIDLADGVHAYDGNGNEVEFTYEPTSIEKCDVGVHEVTYTARGETQNRVAHFCGGRPKLHMLDCGTGKVVVNRLVTILQAKAPKIYGIAKAYLERNQLWNPIDDVTAVDDNGNALEVTHSGVYDQIASGDIASFESVGGKSKSLKVTLEPIQDLHGYDKPWVGGAGKNLSPASSWSGHSGTAVTLDKAIPANTTITVSGLFTRDGTATNNCALLFKYSDDTLSGWYNIAVNSGQREKQTVTLAKDIIAINYYSSNSGWSDSQNYTLTVMDFQLELGSSATSYEPYSNIAPISGRTEVVTHRTKKNLLNLADVTWKKWRLNSNVFYKVSDSSNIVTLQVTGDTLHCKTIATYFGFGFEIGAVNYARTVSVTNYGATGISPISLYSSYEEGATRLLNGRTITIPANTSGFVGFRVDGIREFDTHIQLELGSTATDYEPYQGDTYTTSLGQTVYGGTLDVVTGELVVDRAMVDLGTLNWSQADAYGSVYRSRVPITNAVNGNPSTGTTAPIISDRFKPSYKVTDTPNVSEAGLIGIRYNTLFITFAESKTANEVKSALSGSMLVYELATPQTYHLTPQEVTLLVGDNNVWSDGYVEVAYPTEIPQGEYGYLFDGIYEVTYHTEDECGNETTETRKVIVGNQAVVCDSKVCSAKVVCG